MALSSRRTKSYQTTAAIKAGNKMAKIPQKMVTSLRKWAAGSARIHHKADFIGNLRIIEAEIRMGWIDSIVITEAAESFRIGYFVTTPYHNLGQIDYPLEHSGARMAISYPSKYCLEPSTCRWPSGG